MDVFWLTPIAWWGLATIAIPIAIHLLTRQQTRRVPFPTLRFLHPTRLAALRRRSIHDWPLLLIRVAILAVATAALAGPVFVSSTRSVEWQTRVARALVVAPAAAPPPEEQRAVQEEVRTSFASAVFRPATHLPDGLRDASDWLQRQAPAAREIVILGDLKEGVITSADLALVPPTVGLRFMPFPAAGQQPPTLDLPFARVTLTDTSTTVAHRALSLKPGPPTAGDRISVRAAPEHLAFAEAARDAVLTRGVRGDRAGLRRVLVVFEGADTGNLQLKQPPDEVWMREALARLPGMTGGQQGNTLVVIVPQPAQGVAAVHAIDRAAQAAFAEDLGMIEVRRIPPAVLAGWSRPSQPDRSAPIADEGDRRWLWAAALVLIAVEWLLRRSSATATSEEHAVEEQRVA
jgi:hypothetical protein